MSSISRQTSGQKSKARDVSTDLWSVLNTPDDLAAHAAHIRQEIPYMELVSRYQNWDGCMGMDADGSHYNLVNWHPLVLTGRAVEGRIPRLTYQQTYGKIAFLTEEV